jgi:hypothetical protein
LPEDITRNYGADLHAALVKALASGDWVIDWWKGDPRDDVDNGDYLDRAYYLRPRADNDGPGFYHDARSGSCVLLRDGGCALDPDLRPYGCRILEPAETGQDACVSHTPDCRGAKHAAAMAWLQYRDVVERAAKKAGRMTAR